MTQQSIQRYRCGDCNAIVADDVASADNGLLCPYCGEAWSIRSSPLCDEPGCEEAVCAGWPTSDKSDAWGGYRITCMAHTKDTRHE